ncbi:MAG: 23S rRNA (adenine(2503)-C(2))-methyltransferase RlmN [Pseudomonadota bacterium]|nr:23S rRNA (adenine(2503)-C(2))-methyltransferase RlmN [Pseudomonadota bacterium]
MPSPDHSPLPANLLGMNRPELERFCLDMGEKRFRADQLLQWVHRFGAADFDAMTNLGKGLRSRLAEIARITPPAIVLDRTSADGTRKWVLELHDRNRIEMVFIPEAQRGTLCISSQVGCQLNCRFCATARQGYNRNLDVAEIVGQAWIAYRLLPAPPGRPSPITNIVFMGMGEPMLNLDNVAGAIGLLLDDHAYGLARKRVTVSTAGVVPGIDRLRELAPVSLAVSLHAPDDALRNELVPLNRRYPLEQLMAACKRFIAPEKNRKVTFEYTLMDGVNDSPVQARALVRLLSGVPSKINLIPFNPFPGAPYRRSSDAAIERFKEILLKHGFIATVRRTRGEDIDAACGQLVGQVQPRTRRSVPTYGEVAA